MLQYLNHWAFSFKFRIVSDQSYKSHDSSISVNDRCWHKPAEGVLKCNVDASFYPGTATFTIGMVVRDCRGEFVEGRSMTLMSPDSVFEAECIGVREALSWVLSRGDNREVVVETDSDLKLGMWWINARL
ncbi:hypothetical protein POM88_003751 [Heracleum sosnowskyi]|uniref:RNase H type-1 domain-containing protein n=1 Tax=Heracleum sosnowskyi TaxID=360622 RepID=A0AAD8NDC6_9APIA|nr:hypothetical protein POM88_003751 [Heracleum sosnowskyi]